MVVYGSIIANLVSWKHVESFRSKLPPSARQLSAVEGQCMVVQQRRIVTKHAGLVGPRMRDGVRALACGEPLPDARTAGVRNRRAKPYSAPSS